MAWLNMVLCSQDQGWACRAWPGQDEGSPFSCCRTTMVEKSLDTPRVARAWRAGFLSPLPCLPYWVAEGTNPNFLSLCPNLCSSGTFFLPHTVPGYFLLVCFLINGLKDQEQVTRSG